MRRDRAGRRRTIMGLAAVAIALSPFAPLDGAGADGADMGTIEVVAGGGSSEPLGRGGSATPFSLRIPGTAECPGDSADENYRIQSFIVPADVDPGSLRYFSVMPVGEGRYALYDVFTSPYIQALTAKATARGGPGPIVNIPDLSFAVFPPGKLPPGRYTIGMACTLFNETVRFWDTDIELISDSEDSPGKFRWQVLEPAGGPGSGGSDGPWMPLAGLAVLAVGAGLLSARRRRARVPASAEQR